MYIKILIISCLSITSAIADECQYSFNNNDLHAAQAAGYSLEVSMTEGCELRTKDDYYNDWIAITQVTYSSTNGIVRYWLEANENKCAREAFLTIGNKKFAIKQLGSSLDFQASSLKGNAPLTVNVEVLSECTVLSDQYFLWETSDGQKSIGRNANFTFNQCQKEPYLVALKIVQDGKVYDTVSKPIEVNCPPVADFSYRIMFGNPATVILDASKSSDQDGEISQYDWLINNSENVSGKVAQLQLNSDFNEIILTITDNRGSSNAITKNIEIISSYNDKVRIKPQIIAAGISPSKVNIYKESSYDVVALVRRGIEPIDKVIFKDADQGNSILGKKMQLSGILPNGDEVYRVTYAYDRSKLKEGTISTTWGSKLGQSNIVAIDEYQNISHTYPYLMVGNYPSQKIDKQAETAIHYNNKARFAPQVIMAGYTPAKLDYDDDEFDVIAIVRKGKLPIKHVLLKQNEENMFSALMSFIGELNNGDLVYKMTFSYPRGALGKDKPIDYTDLWGPNSTQFGIEVVDQGEQRSHKFPDIEFGNFPELK